MPPYHQFVPKEKSQQYSLIVAVGRIAAYAGSVLKN